VLSGEEEARYAALGVLAGIPERHGVAGDLGGSSLELIRWSRRQGRRGVTLPLGPFAWADEGFDAELREAIASGSSPAADFATDTLYAVGGAWRTLAQVHMEMSGYPLHVVHQYDARRRGWRPPA
jgi:exopolyphosphatase/guanosine-5'-triphosphate,3'-diphosphate pyrophosphatase